MYLEARQRSREVSYALARRMGLARRAHRRSIALELGAILLVSFQPTHPEQVPEVLAATFRVVQSMFGSCRIGSHAFQLRV